jgi:hexosaminidase
MNRLQRMSFAVLSIVLTLTLGALSLRAQSDERPDLMPLPSKMRRGSGALKLDPGFSISFDGYKEPRLDRAGRRFMEQLHRQTALVFAGGAMPAKSSLTIITDHESKPVQELGEDESYDLEISSKGAKLHAANPLGTLRGLQTVLQLVQVTPDGFAIPAISIQDQPRFPWRGLMIDAARHFIPIPVVKRNLDGMEAVKMNVFHWHLSDNQGFRVESRKFPKLHEQGSDGRYYTQEEIHELISYARDRGIRVVPEFDMPGHSTAWFVGHPEIAAGSGPYQIERQWGVFDPAMDPTNEKTYKFLDEFLAEMGKLFPDQFFHIGGDEVNGKEWGGNLNIQAFMKAHDLKNNEALQGYFSQRVQELVTRHGKTPVGWDEILVPGVPKNIVIQSWRGQDALAVAAKQGYRGILSNGYYLDLGWSAARHYAVDPLGGSGATLTDEQRKLVLGGESCIWSEYVNEENIDSRIWPRNAAIAERFWSPQAVTDAASMYARLESESLRLQWLGLVHGSYQRNMLERMAGNALPEEASALRTLAESLEPVKDYNREKLATGPPTSQTPLNRMVDAVHPESAVSRRFSLLVDQYLASACKDADKNAKIRAQLNEWAVIDAHLQPLAERSFLVKETLIASSALSQAAKLTLAALNSQSQGNALPDDLKKQQLEELSAAEQQAHKAQLTIPALPAMQKIIEASGTSGACAKPR